MKEHVNVDILTTVFGSDFDWDKEIARLRSEQSMKHEVMNQSGQDEDPEYVAEQIEEYDKWIAAQGDPELMKQYEV